MPSESNIKSVYQSSYSPYEYTSLKNPLLKSFVE